MANRHVCRSTGLSGHQMMMEMCGHPGTRGEDGIDGDGHVQGSQLGSRNGSANPR